MVWDFLGQVGTEMTGKLGIAALIMSWSYIISVVVLVYLLIELLVVTFRVWGGETLWSALTKYGANRVKKSSFRTGVAQGGIVKNEGFLPEGFIVGEKVAASFDIDAASNSTSSKSSEAAATDNILLMYELKSKALKMVLEFKEHERAVNGGAGVVALEILLGAIDKALVERIFMIGKIVRDRDGMPTGDYNRLSRGDLTDVMRAGYMEMFRQHGESAVRGKLMEAKSTIDRLMIQAEATSWIG